MTKDIDRFWALDPVVQAQATALKTLILIRGLPGSGKSTLARKLTMSGQGEHVEADMYFTNDGENGYKFDPAKLRDAHEWCQQTADLLMQRGCNTVIVSNTFTLFKEMEPYYRLAREHDYQVQEIICSANFGSVHNVPEATIEKMARRFQYRNTR